MCGITGFDWNDTKLLKKMTDAIKHRGPDDEGYFTDHNVSFGHRRLSIVDLTKTGHQPMKYVFKGKEYVIVFNGEIYNFKEIRKELIKKGHKFNGTSDTEVILAAYTEWGSDCVNYFNGMWAFAIYDSQSKEIFLSRDRFGKKPLYYYHKNGKFIFASEIKSILEHDVPRKINESILSDYLYFDMMDHTNNTFFLDIKKLPQATYAHYNLKSKTLRINRFYSVKIKKEENKNPDFLTLTKNATKLRLIADVPISISLSGGVDSSAIASLIPEIISENSKKSKDKNNNYQKGLMYAFTTATGVKYKGDETEQIKILLKKYPNYNLVTNKMPSSNFADNLRKIIFHMDEPFLGYSPYVRWEISRITRQKKKKILLVGEGPDEIMGGYYGAASFYLKDLIKQFRLIRFISELRYTLKQPEGKEILKGFLFLLAPTFSKKRYLKKEADNLQKKYGLRIAPNINTRLSFLTVKSTKEHLKKITEEGSIPYLVNCNDKMGMANSVESRAPFLDYNIINAAFSLNPNKMINKGYRKAILRDAFKGKVPKEILERRRKEAFAAPIEIYLKDKKMVNRFSEIFKKPLSAKYISSINVIEEFNKLQKNQTADMNFILKSIVLEEWLRLFKVK